MTDPSIVNFTPPTDGKPASGDKTPAPSGSGCGKGCGIFLVVLVVAGLIAFLSSLARGSNDEYDSNNKFEAIAQCEARIEKLLKAPSTAEFDSDATGSGTWTVSGTVDSENSFGAMLRSNFQCTVKIAGNSATTTVDYLE